MMANKPSLSAAEQILLAAADLSPDGNQEFSEWALTVAVWKRDPNKFGCRGFEKEYPDHKRVMMEIMGGKTNNPVRKGWMQKTKPNHYRITKLGLVEAERLRSGSASSAVSAESSANLYDEVSHYALHSSYKAYRGDASEPKTWLGAAAFFGVNRYDPITLQDRLKKARNTVNAAIQYLEDNNLDALRRGPVGGGYKVIPREQILQLKEFIAVLQQRFSVQIQAIMDKAK